MQISRLLNPTTARVGFLAAALLPAPATLAEMTIFERGHYENCVPECARQKEVLENVVAHSIWTGSARSEEEIVKRVKSACISFCGCVLDALVEAFPRIEQQIEAQFRPKLMADWMLSEEGMAKGEQCRQERLVQAYKLKRMRPIPSYCTNPVTVKASGSGRKLKETDGFRYVLEKYYQDLRPRPRDAYARDTISMKAAGFKYQDTEGTAQVDYRIPKGRGVRVIASSLGQMPDESIILSIDNVPITAGVNQVNAILENKAIDDEIVMCGMKHARKGDSSTWDDEFVVTARVREFDLGIKLPAPFPEHLLGEYEINGRYKDGKQIHGRFRLIKVQGGGREAFFAVFEYLGKSSFRRPARWENDKLVIEFPAGKFAYTVSPDGQLSNECEVGSCYTTLTPK